MRQGLFLVLLGVGCAKGEDTGFEVQVDESCDPAITVPGKLGEISEDTPDPHAETYGSSPSPYQVRYTWPSADPSVSAGFLWRTDTDTLASVVEYGIDGLTERAEGVSFAYGGGEQRIHEVRLCAALQPGTTYSYRVGGEGGWSDTFQFTTPGEGGSETVRIGIAGDSRGGYETWGTLLERMEEHDPDFYVFSGDMVDSGFKQEEWDAWFEAGANVLPYKALVPTHGNHEFLAEHYFAQFALPNNEQWFHVRYGDVVVVSLNDTVSQTEHLEEAQVAYIDEAFGAAADDAWRLAMHHRAVYSTSTTHGSAENLQEHWAPAYDRNGVHLVLNGHNHLYERSVPIRDHAEVEAGEGTTYLVTGGAGAPLYTGTTEEWFGLVADPVEHYAIADLGPDSMDVVVRDLSGNLIDSFSIPR